MNADKNINDELSDIMNENINQIKGTDGIKTADESKAADETADAVKKEKAPVKRTRVSKAKKAEPEADGRSIEELFAELDGIIGKLENGDISLEDSFHYYEAGMKLVKNCSGKIDKVEKQILVLNESAVEE